MNNRVSRLVSITRLMDADDGAPPPPNDELDSLLRDWHRENADLAAANRARILAAVERDDQGAQPRQFVEPRTGTAERHAPDAVRLAVLARIGPALVRAVTSRAVRAAACVALTALLATILLMPSRQPASASVINVAEGGELTAFADDGDRLGPCPLQHTDVAAEVSGTVTHVTVRQRYTNPFPRTIEATYAFPLSRRAAVDRMRITVRGTDGSERVLDGEVREQQGARAEYEGARRSGHVTGLLERERPDTFAQSVANIEPGASVTVEIGYVELLERRDGEYRFAFPMTVAPRYVTAAATTAGDSLPEGIDRRAGVVLLGPAELTVISPVPSLGAGSLQSILTRATPIRKPTWLGQSDRSLGEPDEFVVRYADGTRESGQYFGAASIGQVADRWFHAASRSNGSGETTRVAPLPIGPAERAGQEVSVSVTIDSGGLPIDGVRSERHEITDVGGPRPNTRTISLASKPAIPNRDFVLAWRTSPADGTSIGEGILTHVRTADDETAGGYFAVLLDPPARPRAERVLPREFAILLDTGESMRGLPLENAKGIVGRAIASMRPADTFNVIASAGGAALWTEPRAATEENRRVAIEFTDRAGGGATEMLTALDSAVSAPPQVGKATAAGLADIVPSRIVLLVSDGLMGNDDAIVDLVRQHAERTRVFAIGVGTGANRPLLDAIARAGRGTAEFATLPADVEDAVARFTQRVGAPLLVDISASFSGVDVTDLVPAPDRIPDLNDNAPIVLFGRCATPGVGAVTLRGRSADGAWERTLPLSFTGAGGSNRAIASLWARATADRLAASPIDGSSPSDAETQRRRDLVRLAERYGILTPLTSFVAVERSRMNVGGRPMLVQVPVELPEDTSWRAIFGDGVAPAAWATRTSDGPAIEYRRALTVSALAKRVLAERGDAAGEKGAAAEPADLFFDDAAEVGNVIVDRNPHDQTGGNRSDADRADRDRADKDRADRDLHDALAAKSEQRAPRPLPDAATGTTGTIDPGAAIGSKIGATTEGRPTGGRTVTALRAEELERGSDLGRSRLPAFGIARVDASDDRSALPLQRGGAESFVVDDQDIRARAGLETVLSVHFNNRFDEVLEYMRRVTGVEISPDWDALKELSIHPEDSVVLALDKVPASVALDRVLGQLGANLAPTYAVKQGVVAITTDEALRRRPTGDGEVPPAASNGPPGAAGSDTGAMQGKRNGGAPATAPGQPKSDVAPPGAVAPTDDARKKNVAPPQPPAPLPGPGEGAGGGYGGGGGGGQGAPMPAGSSKAPKPEPPQPMSPAPAAPAPAASPEQPGHPKSDPSSGGPAPAGDAPSPTRGAPAKRAAAPSEPPARGVDALKAAPLSTEALGQPSAPAKPGGAIASATRERDAAGATPLRLTNADRDQLARRVHRELLVVALAAQIDEENAVDLATTATPPIAVDAERRIAVTILVDAKLGTSAPSHFDALRLAGGTIEGHNDASHVIVVRVALRDLLRLALADGVRRVEPLRGMVDAGP